MNSDHLYYLKACMDLAHKSPCLRMHFGCIIVKNGQIISTGYNYPVLRNCQTCIREKLKIPHGTRLGVCWAIHAEQSALLKAGPRAKDADLYIVGVRPNGEILYRKKAMKFYCTICARFIVASGIRRLYGLAGEGKVVSGTPKEAMLFSMEVATGKRGYNTL